ncbi:MAG: hypothetical protein HQ551_06900 [Desulfobacteraceae bacterium]|nr:hypothetical protein [Desulfobacteraceae bacterium]
MKKLIERFSGLVKGTITGFDRIVFKGFILPLMSAEGAMKFCGYNNILNKDYKKWMMGQSKCLIEAANQYGKENCGQGIIPISTWRIRKEALAHKRQIDEKIENGLIGIWSCLESASSYRARYCERSGYPQLRNYQTRCKHLYFYFDHNEYGFMNIRLQTWFPYHIQICLNGREWLRRCLEQKGVDFLVQGNKFLHISDYQEAQALLNKQLDVRFVKMLDGFVPIVFPMIQDVLGPHLSYYWTMWQSEWAADLIFPSPKELNPIMDSLLRHAHMTGTSTHVLRYLDRPITLAGKPDGRAKDEVLTRVTDFNDGIRVRHWVDKNSAKIYNEQNVLRIEATINDPGKFRVFRHKKGQSSDEPKSLRPIRKGVMDIPLRAKISQQVNDRLMDDLSLLHDETPANKLINEITCRQKKYGRTFRALGPTGKDRELLQALGNPEFRISGLTNKMLRQSLSDTNFGSGRTQKQLSAKISRHLRLLRAHGIIRKLPKQNRYQMTLKGVKLTNILNAFLAASTEQLLEMAA